MIPDGHENVSWQPRTNDGSVVYHADYFEKVVQKGGISVEAANTNEDDFVKNLMTIRAEERLALAVRRPAGFKKLTKAAG